MRIEKADRFWSAPSGTKPQVRCAWRVTLRGNAQRFSPTVTDATERTITMRTKFCTQSSTHHFLTIFHGNMSGALNLGDSSLGSNPQRLQSLFQTGSHTNSECG